ncbi:ABC transporter permease [Spirochaeta cellobiosiphila]|uniref:ABC transporter permease n=1 Tax=Spirochaeta cellobiosiphila TaxID=504483 RepID=UPI0003F5F3DA|nr:ABC transporter permease [Spirochaeta cellobiosiphila]
MKLLIQERYEQNFKQAFLTFIGSMLVGLIIIGFIFLSNGVNPFHAMAKIFLGSFGSAFGFKSTIAKAIPLILISTGLIVVFQGKYWNIGAEGQLLMGAVGATWAALNLSFLPGPMLLLIMFGIGFICGGIWALLAALFKIRFGMNEVISTLMLNYIAAELVKFLVIGPWKGKTQFGFPYTDDFPKKVQLALLKGTRIHIVTLVIAVIAAILIYILMKKTRFGYEVRVIGENKEAAKYAGIHFVKTTIYMMLISGGLAGLAGVGEVAGVHHHLTYPDTISSGYGFTAIIVAWLAKLHPLYAILASIFFAGIVVGGDAIQISFGLPAATVQVFNGILLIALIGGEFFLKNKVSLVKGGKA